MSATLTVVVGVLDWAGHSLLALVAHIKGELEQVRAQGAELPRVIVFGALGECCFSSGVMSVFDVRSAVQGVRVVERSLCAPM